MVVTHVLSSIYFTTYIMSTIVTHTGVWYRTMHVSVILWHWLMRWTHWPSWGTIQSSVVWWHYSQTPLTLIRTSMCLCLKLISEVSIRRLTSFHTLWGLCLVNWFKPCARQHAFTKFIEQNLIHRSINDLSGDANSHRFHADFSLLKFFLYICTTRYIESTLYTISQHCNQYKLWKSWNQKLVNISIYQ